MFEQFELELHKYVSNIHVLNKGIELKEIEVFEKTSATGALAASIFHFGEVSIADTKSAMAEAGIEVRR